MRGRSRRPLDAEGGTRSSRAQGPTPRSRSVTHVRRLEPKGMVMTKLTRNEFLKLIAVVIGTGGALAACSSDESNGTDDGVGDDGSSGAPSSNTAPGSGSDASAADDAGRGTDAKKDDASSSDQSDASGEPPPPPPPPPPSCTDNGARGQVGVSGGHSHGFADIPVAHFDEPILDRTYLLADSGGHTHQLTLTAAELTMLKNGQSVTKSSTVDAAHAHDVVLVCI